MTDDELTDGEPSNDAEPLNDGETADSVLEHVELAPPASRSQCPNCGDPVATVTSRGPLDHTAGPCGCSLTPGQMRRL
ncbi:hypothetical protein [Natrinema halophilum]|uniref:Small CPxCG-related zinc finger protein n=1 Tax=Natrinema halophilum TaxID=1699371 RepID=A0A7D5GIV8_9EURY|nr:hypothetical protein [Natrinema halophilum]QLG47332.1 hypothetical protein HYG82_16285 [Natrinema halophilum]